MNIKKNNLEWTTIENETLILNNKTNKVLLLNSSASLIWYLLLDGLTEIEIKQKIIQSLNDLDESDLENDIKNICFDLQQICI